MTNPTGLRALVLWVGVAASLPPVAWATTLVAADLGELARDADVIVRGRVIAVESIWREGRRGVDSIVTLAADEYLTGDLGPRVLVRVPGGTIGRYRSVVPGAPVFVVGEEVVLFLRARPPILPVLVGLGQGVFRLVVEPTSGRRLVVSPIPAAASGRPTRLLRGDPARRPVPFTDFRARLAEHLASRRDARTAPGSAPRRSTQGWTR